MPPMFENDPIFMCLWFWLHAQKTDLRLHHLFARYVSSLRYMIHPHVSSLNHLLILPMCLNLCFTQYKSGLLHFQTNNDKPL